MHRVWHAFGNSDIIRSRSRDGRASPPLLSLSLSISVVSTLLILSLFLAMSVLVLVWIRKYPCFNASHVYANLGVLLLVTSYPPLALTCLPVRIQTLPHQLPDCRNAGRVCALWLSPDASRLVICTGETRKLAPSHITHPRNYAQMGVVLNRIFTKSA